MPRKTIKSIDLDGKVFESRLEHAKTLFGSQNYQLSFYEERIAFNCIASQSQVIEAWHAKANFTISTLDRRKACYVTSVDLEHILDLIKGEQFIYCTYWIVLNA